MLNRAPRSPASPSAFALGDFCCILKLQSNGRGPTIIGTKTSAKPQPPKRVLPVRQECEEGGAPPINAGLQSLQASTGTLGKVAVIVDRDLVEGS